MAWRGKPKWNGKEVKVDLENCLLVFVYNLFPFLLHLEYCKDRFLPIFSSEDMLRSFMREHGDKMIDNCPWSIKKIDGQKEFMDSVLDQGVRIMLDPNVINPHHTKWHEVVRDGEQWKFVDAENN